MTRGRVGPTHLATKRRQAPQKEGGGTETTTDCCCATLFPCDPGRCVKQTHPAPRCRLAPEQKGRKPCATRIALEGSPYNLRIPLIRPLLGHEQYGLRVQRWLDDGNSGKRRRWQGGGMRVPPWHAGKQAPREPTANVEDPESLPLRKTKPTHKQRSQPGEGTGGKASFPTKGSKPKK